MWLLQKVVHRFNYEEEVEYHFLGGLIAFWESWEALSESNVRGVNILGKTVWRRGEDSIGRFRQIGPIHWNDYWDGEWRFGIVLFGKTIGLGG